jgi:hypothetical protein
MGPMKCFRMFARLGVLTLHAAPTILQDCLTMVENYYAGASWLSGYALSQLGLDQRHTSGSG